MWSGFHFMNGEDHASPVFHVKNKPGFDVFSFHHGCFLPFNPNFVSLERLGESDPVEVIDFAATLAESEKIYSQNTWVFWCDALHSTGAHGTKIHATLPLVGDDYVRVTKTVLMACGSRTSVSRFYIEHVGVPLAARARMVVEDLNTDGLGSRRRLPETTRW